MTTQTANTLLIEQKSTNVRSHVSTPVWLRTTFSTASRVAPGLTAAVAERLFFKTRRSGPRAGEHDVLGATARRCFWSTAGTDGPRS
jgi:hypothetical protein